MEAQRLFVVDAFQIGSHICRVSSLSLCVVGTETVGRGIGGRFRCGGRCSF